jgi:hypothetical protein
MELNSEQYAQEQDPIEKLVLVCIDTAKAMLEEYQTVIPFGIRAFKDNDDLKMNCPGDKNPEANFDQQIEDVVSELKEFVKNENIFATALVTELESEGEKAIGLQVENEMTSVLFVYPFHKNDDKSQTAEEWIIEAPIQTDQLLNTVYTHH